MFKSSFIVVVIAAVIFSSVSNAQESCGVNEARYPCGKRCEETCNVPLPGFCKGIRCLPPFGCRCKTGFARDPTTNTCIPKENC